MAEESVTISQKLMTGALLHFERGVPIADLDIRREHKERLARVQHVYWQWVKNPIVIDPFQLLRQLTKGKGADVYSEWRMAQKDKFLFDFVVEHIAPPSRRVDEAKVRAAADKMMQIGMATDNVNALDKGSKRLMEVAQLDKPEDARADMSKVAFLPTVVVTDIREVDETKENIDDEETKRIIAQYDAFVDEKHQAIDDKVAVMEARSAAMSMMEPEPPRKENAIVIKTEKEEESCQE